MKNDPIAEIKKWAEEKRDTAWQHAEVDPFCDVSSETMAEMSGKADGIKRTAEELLRLIERLTTPEEPQDTDE